MPRKGWSTLEMPDGFLQVIRGPRPRAVRWAQSASWSWTGQAELKQERAAAASSCSRGSSRPTTSLSSCSGASCAFTVGSGRIGRRQQFRGQDVARRSEEGTTGDFAPRRRRESQEQVVQSRRSVAESSRRASQVGAIVEGWRTAIGGASSGGFRAGPRTPGDWRRGRSREFEEVGDRVAVSCCIPRGEQTRQLARSRGVVEIAARGGGSSTFSGRSQTVRAYGAGRSRFDESVNPHGSPHDAGDAKRRCVETPPP